MYVAEADLVKVSVLKRVHSAGMMQEMTSSPTKAHLREACSPHRTTDNGGGVSVTSPKPLQEAHTRWMHNKGYSTSFSSEGVTDVGQAPYDFLVRVGARCRQPNPDLMGRSKQRSRKY